MPKRPAKKPEPPFGPEAIASSTELDLVRRDEFDGLRAEIADLRARLEAAEAKASV